jgi:hypothetical protein
MQPRYCLRPQVCSVLLPLCARMNDLCSIVSAVCCCRSCQCGVLLPQLPVHKRVQCGMASVHRCGCSTLFGL